MPLEPHNRELLAALQEKDLERVITLVEERPELLSAPTGDPRHGDLLAFAAQSGDLALVRLAFDRVPERDVQAGLARACRSPVEQYEPIIEYLMARGANPRGLFNTDYGPILFVPCESLQPDVLHKLLSLGADPRADFHVPDGPILTPLDVLVSTHVRQPQRLQQCIAVLAHHGVPVVDSPFMAVYRNDEAALGRHLGADSDLVQRRYDLPCANTPLLDVTLLHVAAEFCVPGIARLLLDHGADIDARAGVDDAGFGGQTPVFHTVNSYRNQGFEVFKLLIERGADFSVRADLRHYGFSRQLRGMTPLGYALEVVRDGVPHPEVVDVLRLLGAEA